MRRLFSLVAAGLAFASIGGCMFAEQEEDDEQEERRGGDNDRDDD